MISKVLDSNKCSESSELDPVEGFGKTISDLVVGVNPINLYSALLDLLLDKAPADVHVLGAAISKRWALGQVNCRLNKSLHRLKIVDTADCQCGEGEESIQHVLLHCPRWTAARVQLQAVAGDRWGEVSYLLGGWCTKKHWKTGEPLDGPKEKWKPDLNMVKHTIRFLQQTGRLATSQTG